MARGDAFGGGFGWHCWGLGEVGKGEGEEVREGEGGGLEVEIGWGGGGCDEGG